MLLDDFIRFPHQIAPSGSRTIVDNHWINNPIFGLIDAATKGSPGKETSNLVYKVYYDGFKSMDLGGSAAQSVVLMVIVVALNVVQFRFVEKKVNY